jgi:hypothetical protein
VWFRHSWLWYNFSWVQFQLLIFRIYLKKNPKFMIRFWLYTHKSILDFFFFILHIFPLHPIGYCSFINRSWFQGSVHKQCKNYFKQIINQKQCFRYFSYHTYEYRFHLYEVTKLTEKTNRFFRHKLNTMDGKPIYKSWKSNIILIFM